MDDDIEAELMSLVQHIKPTPQGRGKLNVAYRCRSRVIGWHNPKVYLRQGIGQSQSEVSHTNFISDDSKENKLSPGIKMNLIGVTSDFWQTSKDCPPGRGG